MSPTDPELVRRCLAGDERAYRELIERYERQVYSVAMRMVRVAEDAEDLTQETFIRMFKALDRYDPARPRAPPASWQSTSRVGLPRESRISRAFKVVMVNMEPHRVGMTNHDNGAARGYVRLPRPSSRPLANSKSHRSLTIAEPDA